MVNSNNVTIKYVPESAYGITPSNSTDWNYLRYSSETINADLSFVESSAVERDRMLREYVQTAVSVSGGFSSDFSLGIYDKFIESVFCSTWNGDNLDIGYNYTSFTFEKHYIDLDKYSYFTGMRVNEMNLNIVPNDKITSTFNFLGKESDVSTQSLVGVLGSVTDYPYAPITVSNRVGALLVDNNPVELQVTELTLNINNNLRQRNCIGSKSPVDTLLGEATVTGTISMFLTANAWEMYKKVATQEDMSFYYEIDDGDNKLLILLPRIRLNSPTPTITGKDNDVYVQFEFRALRDNSLNTAVRISKRYGYSDGVDGWYNYYFLPYSGSAY